MYVTEEIKIRTPPENTGKQCNNILQISNYLLTT